MPTTTLFDALEALGPNFRHEIRTRLAPVKDRFFPTREFAERSQSDDSNDGLFTAPPFLADPELLKVSIQLAELALKNGIDVDIAWSAGGSTLLHYCVLLRDSATAVETVTWLLAHGADSNKVRDEDGESPLSLALKLGRAEIVGLLRGSQ